MASFYENIEDCLYDKDDFAALKKIMEKEFAGEATAFWEYYFKYEKGNEKERKEIASEILKEFCTLEGNFPLPNYTTNYVDIKEKIDKIEKNNSQIINENDEKKQQYMEYPIDLFDSLTIESIKLIEKHWKLFIRSDKKYAQKYDPNGHYSIDKDEKVQNLASPKSNLTVDSSNDGDSDTDYDD